MQDQSNTNKAMNISSENLSVDQVINIPSHRMSVNGTQIINDLSTQITITYHNLSKVIQVPAKMIDPESKEKIISRTLIDDISGQILSGQVVALMGPSGCGKTTLLNILSGRALHGVTGDVWINNQRYEKSMKHKFAYVLQEDLFFESLTVKQQLTYTALLRLPKTMTRKDKIAQVNDIIGQLRLDKCANTPIMLVSGGEKRRTNIATELLTNPSVIFLDEPTSGLDSTSAVSLIGVLRELAMQGKTIITSIHQPSSQIFQSFDHLILLADGKTIFMGKPSNVIDYFGLLGHQSPPQYNPADFMMDLVNQDMKIRDNLKDAYLKNRLAPLEYHLTPEPSGKETDLPKSQMINFNNNKQESKWAAGYLTQTSILFQRNLVLTAKAQFSKLNCIQALSLSIMCGLLWLRMDLSEKTLKDRASLIFFLLIFWPLEICFAGIISFQCERSIIQKERASGSFRLSTYYLAKCLSETPLKIVLPAFSFIIVYWMGNMNSNFGIFIAMMIFVLMVVLVAESLGLLFGALFGSIGRAWVAGNVILLGLLLIGGYFIENIPYWLSVWIKWISFYKYAYDATIQLEFMGNRVFKCVSGTVIKACENNLNGTFTGKDALTFFKPDLDIGWNFLVLFGMFVAFRIAVYIVLRFVKHNDGRI